MYKDLSQSFLLTLTYMGKNGIELVDIFETYKIDFRLYICSVHVVTMAKSGQNIGQDFFEAPLFHMGASYMSICA